MRNDSEQNRSNKLTPTITQSFIESEVYPYFGLININNNEFSCTVSIIVAASEDIEIDKVIGFIKNFIPSQLEENSDKKFLSRFKAVNEKISQVLSDTLEGESFIDVALAYVLIKEDFFYVSLDDLYDLNILRNVKVFSLRKEKQGTIDGSGALSSKDELRLSFNEIELVNWTREEEINGNNEDNEDNEVGVNQNSSVEQISNDENIQYPPSDASDTMEVEEMEINNEINENIDNNDVESKKYSGNNLKDKLMPMGKNVINKLSPKIKDLLTNGVRYVGEAFSYLIFFIFRKKKSGISKALPNKKKGFLIISGIVFCIILLSFFIKSTSEENARKQTEQKYRDDIALVGTNIKTIEDSSNAISIGDKTFEDKLSKLRDDVKTIDSNPLKGTINAGNDIDSYNSRINLLEDKVQGILRVDEASVISRFGGFISNPNPSDMAYRDGKIYLTDLNNAKVYSADANTTGSVTEVISTELSKPQAIEFTKSKLLVLDTVKGIVEVDITGKKVKKLAGYDSVAQTSTALKSYYDKDADNFYLLQPQKKAIQRVPGLGNGNFAVAGKYNKDDFDDDVIDFSIIGGSAYTIDTAGNVNKYTRSSSAGATKDPLNMPFLDLPIGNDARIVGMEPRTDGPVYLFVSDPSNNRILIFDNKDGQGNVKFVVQYKPQDDNIFNFKDIKSLIIDESNAKISLYALSSYGLFKINVDIK